MVNASIVLRREALKRVPLTEIVPMRKREDSLERLYKNLTWRIYKFYLKTPISIINEFEI